MFEQVKISPSILSADLLRLSDEIGMLERSGADWVHVDVMDGHFVPNLTFGVPLVKQLKKITRLPLDVHLMISNPLVQIPWYLEAGADLVTFHAEAVSEAEALEAMRMIHDAGAKAGIAIKPKTPAESIAGCISEADMILVMSVEPGFSGQSYIEGTDKKVAEVVDEARAADRHPLVQVDGGINAKTLVAPVEAGADVLVCGNSVFATDDPASALRAIRHAASGCGKRNAEDASCQDARLEACGIHE